MGSVGLGLFWEYRISYIFVMVFVCLFSKLKMNKFLTGVCMLIGFIMDMMLDYFLYIFPLFKDKEIMVLIFQAIIVQGIVFLISKYKDWRSVFIGFSGAVFALLGELACEFGFFGLRMPMILGLGAGVITHVIVLVFMWIFVRKIFIKEIDRPGNIKEWFYLCFFPAFGYIAVMTLEIWPMRVSEVPEVAVTIMTILVIIYSTYAIIARTFQSRQREAVLAHNKDMLESYSRHLRQEADEMERKNREVAIIRHDIKHDYAMILSFLEAGEYDSIEELIKKRNSDIEKTRLLQYCGNITVDGILSRWKAQADKYHVGFEVTANIGKIFPDSEYEFEFAATLSNLLENAIDATSVVTEQERIVRVVIRENDKKVGVIISNPYIDGTVNRDLETSRLVSAKGEGHGFGTQSVRSFCEKHNAHLDSKFENCIAEIRLVFTV